MIYWDMNRILEVSGLSMSQSFSGFKSIWQLYFFIKSMPIIPSHGIGKFDVIK